jgi:hypothetical protein
MENGILVHPDGGLGMRHISDVLAPQIQPSVNDQPGTRCFGDGAAEIRENLEPVKILNGIEQIQKKTVYDIQDQLRIHPNGIDHLIAEHWLIHASQPPILQLIFLANDAASLYHRAYPFATWAVSIFSQAFSGSCG